MADIGKHGWITMPAEPANLDECDRITIEEPGTYRIHHHEGVTIVTGPNGTVFAIDPADLIDLNTENTPANEATRAFAAAAKLPMIEPVPLPVCPRWLHERNRKCLKPLTDYKCPQHGLIREVMPKRVCCWHPKDGCDGRCKRLAGLPDQCGNCEHCTPDSDSAKVVRDEAIKRLATGLAIPAELLTHQPGSGHYGHYQTEQPMNEHRGTYLNDLAGNIHNISKAKGFWPDTEGRPEAARNPAEVLMLIVSEAAEALEAIRDGHPLNEALYTTSGKPEGVPSEMADIIIRTLDACAAWGIDIDTAIREKIEYNYTRDHLHGRAR